MERINFKENKLHYILAGIVLVIGIIIRFWGFDEKSLWIDEIYSFMFSHQKTFLESLTYMLCDLSPPIYYLFLYFWMQLFGISEFVMRLPSVIFGILSIPAIYFSAQKLFNRQVALTSTILTALSPTLLYYSQEARGYSLLILLSIITTAIWIEILKRINNTSLDAKICEKYSTLAFLTIFTHYWSIVFVFFQLIYTFIFALQKKVGISPLRKISIKIFVYSGLFFVLQYSVLKQLTAVFDTSAAKVTINNSLLEVAKFLLYDNYYFLAVIAIFFIINFAKVKNFIISELQEKKLASPLIYFSFIIICPIIVYFIMDKFTSYIHPRYLMFAIPAIYLLIGYICTNLYEKHHNILIFAVTSVFLGIYLFVPQKIDNREFTYYNRPKQEWKEATKYVINNADKNTLIILDRVNDPFYDYYFDKFNKNIKNYNFIVDRSFFDWQTTTKKIANYKKKYKKIYVFSTSMLEVNEINNIMRNPQLTCKQKPFVNVNFYECN
jgi:uncharacterized membrane protein